MILLAPLWFTLGALVAVPLLIHFMRRRSGVRVEFPAARYLVRAEREQSRRLKVRNLLLLLLRVAIVLLVAAAAAEPIGRLRGAGHAPTALAIVVDNSMSSGAVRAGRPVLGAIADAARALLDEATPEDQVWIVAADGSLIAGDAASARSALDRLAPLAGRGDPPTALRRAHAAVEASTLPERRVAVVSDGQRTSWPPSDRASRGNVSSFVVDGAARNRAIVAARPAPTRWTPDGAVELEFLDAEGATPYRVAAGGRTIARGTTGPASALAMSARATATAPSPGWLAGVAELEPDELRADDVRHFAIQSARPLAVRVAPSAGEFAVRAVEALVGAGRLRVGDGALVAPATDADRLPALLLAPSSPGRTGEANRALVRLGVPWRFGTVRRDTAVARGSRVDGVEVFTRYELVATGASANAGHAIATVGEQPWIVAGANYVITGSPLEPAATALPLRAAFAPLLLDLLGQRLSTVPGTTTDAAPGERVRVAAGATALEAPDGKRRSLSSDTLPAPTATGVYFWLRGGERAGALVVNTEAEESRVEGWGRKEFAARVGDRSGGAGPDGASRWAAGVFAAASRRALAQALLWGAIGALVLESALARLAARRSVAAVRA